MMRSFQVPDGGGVMLPYWLRELNFSAYRILELCGRYRLAKPPVCPMARGGKEPPAGDHE
jgi:hypothetical protein